MSQRRLFLAGLALAACTGAFAQATKPIRLIVPYAPGGPLDVTARALAERVQPALGSIVVDNKPGAGGNIGTDLVAKATPDGGTIGIAAVATHAINPWLYAKLPFDPRTDFAPITQMVRVPNVLVINAGTAERLGIRSLGDLIRYAKANPAKLNYGSGGNGSAGHLAFEYLKMASDTFVTHVPYRGTGPQLTDLMGGRLEAAAVGAPAVMQFIKTGKLRCIATGTTQRLAQLHDVPTVAEQGFPGFEMTQWYGLLAPSSMAKASIDKLAAASARAIKEPAALKLLEGEAAIAVGGTPAEFAKFIEGEQQRWKPVIARAKIKPD